MTAVIHWHDADGTNFSGFGGDTTRRTPGRILRIEAYLAVPSSTMVLTLG